jgi:hypothetical protein
MYTGVLGINIVRNLLGRMNVVMNVGGAVLDLF